MGEDIRKRVVTSFKSAIDCEQNNNNIEAYRKYLDGVALVAAALQQDAECTWDGGNSSLSEKERRSLLGFAKQSVDRLMILLDQQEPNKIFQATTNVSTKSDGYSVNNLSICVPHSTSSNQQIHSPKANKCTAQETFDQSDEDISPIAHMRKENQLLMSRYAARLRTATSKAQRHNLQLELERRLMENSAIAQQQQEAWEKKRNNVTKWCLQIAEVKFKIKEKIECGSITEVDFKKQRLYAAALQYEEEHLWLKRIKQDLLSSPKDEERQRDIIVHTLNDRLHPLGSLIGQMQHGILNKIHPLIRTLPDGLSTAFQNVNVNKQNSRITSFNARKNSEKDMNQSGLSDFSNCSASEQAIAREERKALQQHFNNIADDMKQDVKFLETLLCALYEPLMTEPGASILTEVLHELYFPPIKPAVINLIRMGISEEEEELAYRMTLQKENKDTSDIDEELTKSCGHALYRMTCLGSPCQMLDSLTAILKTLAIADDSQMKSIGADDLLPRLMTVVMSSGLLNLLAESIYMENFMPVGRALGEAGYCLTVLQSVMTSVQMPTG